MSESVLSSEPKKHKTNIVGLGVVALLALSLIFVGKAYVADVNTSIENSSAGIVAGVETVRQEATLVINAGTAPRSFVFELAGNTTAFDLLNRASMRENFVVETKSYDFGVSVEAIDGIRGGTAEGHYWIYYINGKMATVGADAYVVQPGDSIEFRYDAAQ
ncbi:MAG: DUF4430 domain-containing protein [Patescibacteria group bacterium]|jgi:hypothetical protein